MVAVERKQSFGSRNAQPPSSLVCGRADDYSPFQERVLPSEPASQSLHTQSLSGTRLRSSTPNKMNWHFFCKNLTPRHCTPGMWPIHEVHAPPRYDDDNADDDYYLRVWLWPQWTAYELPPQRRDAGLPRSNVQEESLSGGQTPAAAPHAHVRTAAPAAPGRTHWLVNPVAPSIAHAATSRSCSPWPMDSEMTRPLSGCQAASR